MKASVRHRMVFNSIKFFECFACICFKLWNRFLPLNHFAYLSALIIEQLQWLRKVCCCAINYNKLKNVPATQCRYTCVFVFSIVFFTAYGKKLSHIQSTSLNVLFTLHTSRTSTSLTVAIQRLNLPLRFYDNYK